MIRLDEAKENQNYKVISISGDDRFVSRITSIGITIGNLIKIVKNKSKYPILIYSRDTIIAIGRNESDKIKLEVV